MTGISGHGVGFFLSGALVSLSAAILFSTRATRAVLPSRTARDVIRDP